MHVSVFSDHLFNEPSPANFDYVYAFVSLTLANQKSLVSLA